MPVELKRKQVGVRFDPETYAALDYASKHSGRTLAQEVEHRASMFAGASQQTIELLQAIAARIGELEKATHNCWHENLETWSAVKSMLGDGPISAAKPLFENEEEEMREVIAPIKEIAIRQHELVNRIASLGATVKEFAMPASGLGANTAPRRTEIAAIEAISDDKARNDARLAHEELQELDGARLAAMRTAQQLMSLHTDEIARGAERWRDISKAEAVQRRSIGEKLRIDQLAELFLIWR